MARVGQVSWVQLEIPGPPEHDVTVAVTGVTATANIGAATVAIVQNSVIVPVSGVTAAGHIGHPFISLGATNTDGTFADLLTDTPICLPSDSEASIVSDWADFGSIAAGTWALSGHWEKLDSEMDDPIIELDFSNDGVSILRTVDWATGTVTARYARLVIAVPAGTILITNENWQITRTRYPRQERGTVAVDSDGRATVTLQNLYSEYTAIILTPLALPTAAPTTCVYDAVALSDTEPNTFDVVLFGADNQPRAGEVSWSFYGI